MLLIIIRHSFLKSLIQEYNSLLSPQLKIQIYMMKFCLTLLLKKVKILKILTLFKLFHSCILQKSISQIFQIIVKSPRRHKLEIQFLNQRLLLLKHKNKTIKAHKMRSYRYQIKKNLIFYKIKRTLNKNLNPRTFI